MATVKINGMSSALRNIKKGLKKTIESNKLKNEVGKFVVERIVQMARSGKNERTGKALPKLSKSYREMRLGIIQFRTINGNVVPLLGPDERLNDTDSQFFEPTRARSNVTFTGQLLKSLAYRTKKNSIIIIFKPDQRSDGLKNSDVYGFLVSLNSGYDFIGLGQKGIRRVNKIVVDNFRRRLRSK